MSGIIDTWHPKPDQLELLQQLSGGTLLLSTSEGWQLIDSETLQQRPVSQVLVASLVSRGHIDERGRLTAKGWGLTGLEAVL